MKQKRWVRTVLFGAAGAIAGYAYYHFIGCASGTCPITGNPYASTLYGAFMGSVLGWPKSPVPQKEAGSGKIEGKEER